MYYCYTLNIQYIYIYEYIHNIIWTLINLLRNTILCLMLGFICIFTYSIYEVCVHWESLGFANRLGVVVNSLRNNSIASSNRCYI